jgi:hypothetical protein
VPQAVAPMRQMNVARRRDAVLSTTSGLDWLPEQSSIVAAVTLHRRNPNARGRCIPSG